MKQFQQSPVKTFEKLFIKALMRRGKESFTMYDVDPQTVRSQ